MPPTRSDLHLAPGLDLPVDFATEGLVVIGVRGSGKSNTEVRFAEELYRVESPWVSIDPKGDWYGIRMDGPGGPGLSVPVFGGLFGDFPLDESLGVRIANLLVEENLSAVLDVSRMTHGARARFLTDFFNQLMERHQLEPHVRTVIFEEAHRYIPQNVTAKTAALKEAAASVLLEGRSFGLGCWACTQRPARLHNDVLEEVDTALLFRLGVTATADLKRVRDWVKHEDRGDEIGASLTKLKAGEAWVLSPVSLGLVERYQMDRRQTFDSGATPVVGEGAMRRRQATMADIDAPAIKEALADAIEKAKEKDPTELRKRLAAAEAELAKRPTHEDAWELAWWRDLALKFAPGELPEVGSEFTTVGALHLAGAKPAPERELFLPPALIDLRDRLVGALGEGVRLAAEISAVVDEAAANPQVSDSHVLPKPEVPVLVKVPKDRMAEVRQIRLKEAPAAGASRQSAADLGKAERLIVAALAQLGGRQSKGRVAAQAGYATRSKGFTNALSALRTAGLLAGSTDLELTSAGVAVGATLDVAPITDYLEHWKSSPKMGRAERAILDECAARWPESCNREELAPAVGFTNARSKGFTNALSRLRSLGLITRDSEIRLVDEIGETLGR